MADYGVRFMIELATRPVGARLTAAELARACTVSVAFTGKILQRLANARLLIAHLGHDGGFELERAAAQISMLDIVTALAGPLCLNDCLPGGAGCVRKTWCPGHGVWADAQSAVAHVLASQRLDRLAAEAVHNRRRLNLPLAITAPRGAVPAHG
jgi:Rrf2 family protein